MKVQIAFGVAPFDSTTLATNGNWTDVTSSVRAASFRTSTRSDRFGVFSAGSAQVTLDNRARTFDPSYASSPYVGEFLRNVPIRFLGTHSGTDYVQWRGYVTLWTPAYSGPRDGTTTVEATDGLGLLARYDLEPLTTEAYGSDNSGTRIGRVLDAIGFPSGAGYRDLDQGAELYRTFWGVNALEHCHTAALSDMGLFYAQRDGTLTFDAQIALTTTRQTTSQVTLSHDTAPKYLVDSLVRAGVGQNYRNLVRIGSIAPYITVAEVDNVAANDVPVVFQRTDLIMDGQTQAQAVANFYADLYSTETPSTTSVTCLIESRSGAGNQTTLFNVGDLRDRVTVEFNPPGAGSDIVDECFVDGIAATITPALTTYTYTLSSADAYDQNLSASPADWLIIGTDLVGTGKLAY